MNIEKWNDICFLLSENVKKGISENAFEQCVIQALRELDWKQSSGDYDIRPSYPIGAANRITPDFVIKSANDQKLFVIEIKQPDIEIIPAFQQQLFSYMRQLKLEYGILIGQTIQVFYDGPLSGQNEPVLLETIKFIRNNEKGEKFVSLFAKGNFDFSLLNQYTENALKEINRRQDFKLLLEKISSKNYKEDLIKLIKQEFIIEYDEELIDSVLNDLEIEISIKNKFRESLNQASQVSARVYNLPHIISNAPTKSASTKDYTKYLFNGQLFGKSRLVLAVIKDYVGNNPLITFSELKAAFPDKLQGTGTFTTDIKAKEKEARLFFGKPDEVISLVDATIVVSTQWGKFNLPRFINNCKRLNIEISEYQLTLEKEFSE